MGALPPAPTDEVLREALPWWTKNVMAEAHKVGIQHRAARCLNEVWRHQDVVSWTFHGVPAVVDDQPSSWLESPEPSEESLRALQEWASVVIASYVVFYSWCDLSDIEPAIVPSGTTEKLVPPHWASVIRDRKW